MIDLTVKTLDSRNHAFSMSDDATVQQLKTKIEEAMNIPANRQRLIFHGRVMQDDKKLSEYEVHGMVIHLVKSQPPQPGSRPGGSSGSNNSNSADSSGRFNHPRYFGRVDGNTMFGSVVIPVIGETGSGRQGNRALRLISTADRMLQRAVEVLDSYENSPSRTGASRSASATASVSTTPYNSSRDSSGSHSPTTEPSQLGRTSAESRMTSTSVTAQSCTSAGSAEMDSEMDADSNTGTPHITVSNADQSAASTSSASSGHSASVAGNSTQEGSAQDTNQQRQQNRSPTTANMASLLAKLRAVQNRFNPLLMRYHNLISEDTPTSNATQLAERLLLTQTVPEVLHLLSHSYHAISDLTIDWELAPPRQMRAVLAPAIQQLVQLTEGMNPWGLTIPSNFGQQPQAPAAGTANTSTPNAPASTAASTGSATTAQSASPSTAAGGVVPEVTYMTTTFPAEGGEATTTFTTRPAADFETASGPNSASSSGTAPSRTPVVTASIDLTGSPNPGFTAALNTAYAIANRIAAIQSGQQPNQQPQQQQQQQQQSQQTQQPRQEQQQQQPQQQPTQQQTVPGQARGSSIVTLPVGMIDIPANVEFFMEVGPSTITIDSVEATMVTSGSFTPGTNGIATDGNPLNINFPWGSPPPQEFLTSVVQALNRIITSPGPNPNLRRRGSAPESTQNLNMQRRGSAPEAENAETNAAGSAAASTAASGSTSETNSGNGPASGSSPSGAAPGQTSQARGYTATHPTTSTQTRSTARPHVHHIAATQLPGYSGYTDPFLPCHSQFFATMRRNRPSANSGAPMTANNSTQTSSNSGNQAAAASQATGSTANPSASSSTSTPSSAASHTSASVPASTSNQTQQGILSSASALGVAQTSLLNFVQSLAGGSASGNDTLLTSVLGSLVAASNQGNQTEVPIINWIFPPGDDQDGESLLSDLRLAVVRSLTVSDLVALTDSNWDAVNHIRSDLRQFVVQRLCEGSPTEERLEHGVNLLMIELRPHFDIMLDGNLRDDVDAVATLNRFHESIVPEFLKLVLDDERASNFGQNLHDMVHKYLGHLWAIVKHCCANNEAIDAIFQSCVNRMPEDVPLPTWTARAYLSQLRLYTDSLNVPLQDIEPFIVYRTSTSSTQEPLDSSITAAVTSNSSSSSENLNIEPSLHGTSMRMLASEETIEPMDTDSLPAPQATTSAGASSLNVSSHSHSSEEAVTAKSDETPVLPMDTEVPPVPTPEAWHRILPPEWVPIIARDATRQRRPNSQTPLSDSYLAGMPPKRRKVVTANKPQGSLSEVISANMETAIQSSGVSAAGISLVQEEAGSDPRLREAYREQLRATVRANLANNPDFSAERFPNAAQYFGKL